MTDPTAAAMLKAAGQLDHFRFAPPAKSKCGIEPMAFNIVVELDPTETVTKGGIILLESQTEREKLASDEGILVAISPVAFTYARADEWKGARLPQIGDRVLVNRYQGILREKDGKNYRIVEDKMLVAVLREE